MTEQNPDNEGRCTYLVDGHSPTTPSIITRRCVLDTGHTSGHLIELPDGKPMTVTRSHP